jgi:hypothetical protein
VIKVFRHFNPWVVVFVGTALFHVWRQSLEDILIFGGAAALILTQVFGLTKFGFKQQPKVPVWAIALTVVAAALILYFAPRHGLLNTLTLLAFIVIGILLLLYVDQENQLPASKPVKRSRLLWGIWAIVFALIELAAYIGSKLTQDLGRFPTISVLLDPVLDEPLGRATFVALWLIAGVFLFGVRRRR